MFLRASIIALALITSAAACSDDGGTTDTGTSDTGTADTSTGDTGAGDTSTGDTGAGDTGPGDTGTGDTGTADTGTADTGPAGCTRNEDCRAYSSFCDGCECLPLLVSEPDPVCMGDKVKCFVDPCEVAGPVTCDTATGTCVIAD